MAETLRIFVSATKDLEQERALIGHILAELPVQVGAQIRRSPVGGVDYDTMFELISNVDRVYFLMGRDISAPSGAEWELALRLERVIVPFKLAGRRTQAGHEFLRIAQAAPWKVFQNAKHLGQLIGIDLIDTLLHRENRYGLQLMEVEALHLRRRQLKKGLVTDVAEESGAEGGGVIIDPAQALDAEELLQ